MQIEQKQNCFLMLYAQLIVYNKYSWLFSENPTHFRRGLPLTPFIFVTGMMGEEVSIQMLKNGASDYIIKDRLTRLPNAIRQALEKQKEIARRITVRARPFGFRNEIPRHIRVICRCDSATG
jgi:PleD family two-component response regulator